MASRQVRPSSGVAPRHAARACLCEGGGRAKKIQLQLLLSNLSLLFLDPPLLGADRETR
jgi:hypothetical protein